MRWCILGIMLLIGLQTSAFASVNQVEVIASVKGESPLDAQEKAVDYAKKRAFFLTLSKFAPDRARTIAESLTSQQIYSHIRGYELLQDRIDNQNPNYYLAKYLVTVSEDMIRRLISGNEARKQEVNPILVLPVLRNQEQMMLWEEANLWRSIWNGVALERGENILVMPYGDPNDTMMTDSSTILSQDYKALAPLTERYGTGEIAVVVATYLHDQTPPGLDITIRRIGPDVNKFKSLYFETDQRHSTIESLLPGAAREVAAELKEIARTYQGETLRKIANANRMPLTITYQRLRDWVRIKKQLENLPQIVALNVGNIGIDQAQAVLLFNTQPQAMLEIMQANGLFVTASQKEWRITAP